MNSRNYWAVGASFGGHNDKSEHFRQNMEWFDGHAEDGDEKNRSLLEKVQIGDVLVMKSSSTKGPGRKVSFTKVKAVGIVLSKIEYYYFRVEWLNIPNLPMDFDGIWYANTIEPLRQDAIFQYSKDIIMQLDTKKIGSLLQYKKQIILQGPPGTGKTKIAKELARNLAICESITAADIKEHLTVGLKIKSADGYTEYTIRNIGDVNVTVGLKNGTSEYKPSYKEIIKAFAIRMWDGKQTGGNDPYAAAISKYLFEVLPLSQIQIVQFHPSYGYEDFVRGIVAKPDEDGEGVLYEAENRILARFAHKANENYLLRATTSGSPTRADLGAFVSYVIKVLDEKGQFDLTDNIYIVFVDEKRFKYKGDNWKRHPNGLNMKFSELEKIIASGKFTRGEIVDNTSLKSMTRSHATYYAKFFEKFHNFLSKSLEKRDVDQSPRNYVLIIDEINRANLSTVLGELIYALEYRGEYVESMYAVDDDNRLVLPPNLYIIGTMNTADRSVGHVDYAIRRRFAFVDVQPRDLTEELAGKFHKELFNKVSELFTLEGNLSKEYEAKDMQLGHSYFIDKSDAGGDINIRLQYEIKPILREYVKDGILIGEKDGKSISSYIEDLQP